MCAEVNTGKDRFAAFENLYRIDVIKKKRLIEKSFFFAQPYLSAMVSLFLYHVHPCIMKMLLSQPWLHYMENMTVPLLFFLWVFLGIYL